MGILRLLLAGLLIASSSALAQETRVALVTGDAARLVLAQPSTEDQDAARRAALEKVARERQGLAQRRTEGQDTAHRAEIDKAAREEQERLAWQRLEAEQRRRAEEHAARERALAEENARLPAAAATAHAPVPAPPPPRVAAVPSLSATAEPSRSAAVAPAGPAVVAAIQQELKRVGCFTGAVDRKWAGPATSRAVKDFARYARLDAPDLPSAEFLDALKGKRARVCPMVCSPRQSLRNGTCVAKTCPKGERLDDDGDCVEIEKAKPKAKAKAPDSVKARRAQAARRRTIERDPVHEPVRAERPRRAAAAPTGGGGIRGCFVVSGLNYCQ